MAELPKLVRVIDTESTGIEDDAQVVEIGSVDWTGSENELGNAKQTFVKPTIHIPATASAVHHITDDMVAEAPAFEDAITQFEGAPIYAAHNAAFDMRMLKIKAHWVCTYKVAYECFPDAPAYGNQVLRYWLDLAPLPEWIGSLAHRALFDAWTTGRLFERLLFEKTVAEMIEISRRPILLRSFGFGKHVGVPLAQVPRDYLDWMVRQDFDEDVVYTARHYLTFDQGTR